MGTPAVASSHADPRGSLSEAYLPTHTIKRKSGKRKKPSDGDDHPDGNHFVDATASRKILRIGRELVEEDEAESKGAPVAVSNPAFAFDSRTPLSESESLGEDEQGAESWDEADEDFGEEAEIDPKDLDTFNRFNPSVKDPIFGPDEAETNHGQSTNLADLILEKIAAYEAAVPDMPNAAEGVLDDGVAELPAKVVEVYARVGLILSRYKSGKLPKPFKVLPGIVGWESLLYITRPDMWTPNACYEATKIFISSNPVNAQKFLNMVILDRVRDDIRETKRLNVHLYKALKKALFRPAAFFKGFLFPLVNGGTCTLREAHIISSVLVRVSVPVLHSAAALHRLCEIAADQMSMSTISGGATNVFIRVLLDKKYALPYKVIDALVFHFLRFRNTKVEDSVTEHNSEDLGDSGKVGGQDYLLPVLWHRCLLSFAQHYRNDITEDQREALLDLLVLKGHKAIGPEVRRELLEGRGRGVAKEQVADHGDDTMKIDG